MSELTEGTKLVVVVPIQLSEDSSWEPGTVVEIVQVIEDSYEVQSLNGEIGSFSQSELVGEFRWFNKLNKRDGVDDGCYDAKCKDCYY